MRITIATIFPEMFEGFITTSIIKKAVLKGLVEIDTVDIRSFSKDKHRRVDDYPFGGGQGLVMMAQPVIDALNSVKTPESKVIYLTPVGEVFSQPKAKEFVLQKHIILLCGHYEGIDERIMEHVDMCLSIGDFVLTGGEVAAMVVTDAIVRLVDGVIAEASHQQESFEGDLLEYPQYTRPAQYEGKTVPDVLLSGNHEAIRTWRLKQSIRKTMQYRPDLLRKRIFNKEEKKLLLEIESEKVEKD
ncbi:MAG: tRNA (guanosine(37)-N1)-methyltransferase TrmD [Firmicutes bacterium HGW-Firmicutes-10]|nr:MAG: tRNA (guanosine(37)-N1)-methyltransferase TrmD [Firmicutes bacterium HGW-Firmicutes-10]